MSTAAVFAGRAASAQLLARLGHPFAQADPNIVSVSLPALARSLNARLAGIESELHRCAGACEAPGLRSRGEIGRRAA